MHLPHDLLQSGIILLSFKASMNNIEGSDSRRVYFLYFVIISSNSPHNISQFFSSLLKQDHLDTNPASTSKPSSFSRLFSRTRKREQQKLLQQQQQEQLKAASGEKDMVNINVKDIQKGNWLPQYNSTSMRDVGTLGGRRHIK